MQGNVYAMLPVLTRARPEEVAVDLHIHALYLALIVLVWIAAYHVAYWLVALARDPSLVCWSVGPFGVSVVSLRRPPTRRLVTQFAVAAVVLAVLSYVSLYLLVPPPIAGLGRTFAAQVVTIAIPVVLITFARLFGVARDHRYPLWGEARVLTGVQRSLATGARIHFTPRGRVFLRERFGATPHEFLRMVRY